MPDEPVQDSPAPVAQEAAPQEAPRPLSLSNAVEEAFNRINRYPLPPSSNNRSVVSENESANNIQSSSGQGVAAQQPPAPSESQTVAELQAKLERANKGYQELQSRYDKSNNKVREEVLAELRPQMQYLAQMISTGQQQPPAPEEDGYDRPLTRKEANLLVEQKAYQIAKQLLDNDPGTIVGRQMGELSRFREEKPEAQKFNPFINTLLKYFPARQGESLFEHLDRATQLFEELTTQATAMAQANGQGQSVGSKAQSPSGVQPSNPAIRATDQAAQLLERAQRYRQEQGMQATAPTRPDVSNYGNEEEAISAMVDGIMRGRR